MQNRGMTLSRFKTLKKFTSGRAKGEMATSKVSIDLSHLDRPHSVLCYGRT